MKKILPIFLLFLLTTSTTVFAQKLNNTLFFMRDVPQRSKLNPAFQGKCKLFVGLPVINSVYANYTNNSFSYNDIIHEGSGVFSDSLIIDVDGFLDKLNDINYVSQQFEVSLLSAGYRFREYYFSFDITEKQDFHLAFSKEMSRFIIEGNYNSRGKMSDWNPFAVDLTYYREYAVGVSKQINRDLFLGARLKMVFGKANINLNESEISIHTSSSGDLVQLHSVQDLNVSFPISNMEFDELGYIADLEINGDSILDKPFFMNSKNSGFGLDLGMIYYFNDFTKIFMSIIDIGSIGWKDNVYNFKQDADFEWRGADWSQAGNPNAADYKSIDDIYEELVDSIKTEFSVDNTKEKYSSSLPTQFYIGAEYDASEKFSLGGLFRTEFYQKGIRSALTFSGNYQVTPSINLTGSYTLHNRTIGNLGLGISAQAGIAQFYVVSDNFLAPLYVNKMRNFNFRFGINLLFCDLKAKRDQKRRDDCYYDIISRKKSPSKNKKNKRWGLF